MATTKIEYYHQISRQVWRTWTSATSSATTSSYYEEMVMGGSLGGTTTSATSNDVWYSWNSNYEAARAQARQAQAFGQQAVRYSSSYNRAIWSPDDPIQKLYWKNQAEINRIWGEMLAEELKLEKEHAEKTAQEMLLDIIGEEEFKVYEETGQVMVKGRKNDYIIKKSGLPIRIPKGKVYRLGMKQPTQVPMCVHVRDRSVYPPTDNVIALAHYFKYDEDNALKTANHHTPRPAETHKAANF